ncbi:hypothetical protein BDE02_08G158200 [Populus trichocarpa]|nr:hypothetical protein BDE02_08G158200 [Populus trichocarpa]
MPFSFSAQITRWLNGLGINPKNFTSTTFLLGCPNKWKIRRGRIKVRLHDLTKITENLLLALRTGLSNRQGDIEKQITMITSFMDITKMI